MTKVNLSTNFLSFFQNGSLNILCNSQPSISFKANENTITIDIIDIPIKVSSNQGFIKKLTKAKELAKNLKEKEKTLEVQLSGNTVFKLGKDANPKLTKIVTLSNNIEITDLKKLKVLSEMF